MQDFLLFMQRHWVLSIGLLLILLILFILELIRLKMSAAQISPAEATRLINRENAQVIDTRSSEAFGSGHIVDAANIPKSEIENKPQKLSKYKNQPIILICHTGLDSAKIAIKLKEQGYNAFILRGGIQGWRNAELPLIKG